MYSLFRLPHSSFEVVYGISKTKEAFLSISSTSLLLTHSPCEWFSSYKKEQRQEKEGGKRPRFHPLPFSYQRSFIGIPQSFP